MFKLGLLIFNIDAALKCSVISQNKKRLLTNLIVTAGGCLYSK